jgi:polyhydroxyalkanoate synthase subunit PhaE
MNDRPKTKPNGSSGQLFTDWQNWYEAICKPLLNIPQFGLMRYYQEHVGENLDKCCQMQANMSEFFSLLGKPVHQSLQDSHKNLFESIMKNGETKSFKDFYSNWIAIMEKQYMELFRSPEYTRCLNKNMQSFNEFITSRQTVLQDALKILPIPTNKDMDELYKEIYELKKRVKDMEKEKVMH